MRKKTISYFFDNIMWYLIYLFPLVAYMLFGNGSLFIDFISNIGFIPIDTNIIYVTIYSLFGSSGILPLFLNGSIIAYLTYFISVYLLHLVVDFILFIPRLCHKFFNAYSEEVD